MTATDLIERYSLLADGRPLHVRSVQPEDEPGLLALNAAASDRSIYLRFFAANRQAADRYVSTELKAPGPDHHALLAEVGDQVVGVSSFSRVDEAQAEIAVLVADDFQHTGVGTLLLEHLASVARHCGIRQFVAEVLPENGTMIHALRDLGYRASSAFESGVDRIVLDLTPTDETWAALDSRDRTAEVASLRPLLAPRSVVLIGTGARSNSVGRQVLANLVSGGFVGTISIVHPRLPEIDGITCHPSVAALPNVPDLAVVAVPALAVVDVVAELGRHGVGAAAVLSSGFSELGADGIAEQQRLVRVAREHGIRLLGPNCLGLINTDPSVRLNATFAPLPLHRGGLAIASQSGALGIGLMHAAGRSGIGVAQFVSVGNKADVSGNDLLLAWQDDPAVSMIALYLESFGNPRKFARIARRVSRRKPILAIKAGRTHAGQRAGQSHTAAAASSDVVVDALFEESGVIRVDDMGALLDAVRALATGRWPEGPRVAIVGNSGGPEILAADAAAAAGLDVVELSESVQGYLRRAVPSLAGAANPVDLGAGVQPPQLESAIRLVLDSDEVDMVLGVVTQTSVADPAALTETFRRLAATTHKPILVVQTGEPDRSLAIDAQASVAFFEFPEPAARALATMWRYARIRRAPVEREARLDIPGRLLARHRIIEAMESQDFAATGGWLSHREAAGLLDSYGVSVAPYRLARSADEAEAAATELGFPLAIKADGAIAHKTELGGVRLNIRDLAGLREAYAAVGGLTAGAVLLQPMISGDIEIVVGGLQDPQFGPVVMVGAGGILTDLLDDRRVLLAPAGPAEIRAAIDELKLARLLAGFRGRPPVSEAAVTELVGRIGQLVADLPDVAELDLNPVIGVGDSLTVVDVKIRLAAGAPRPDAAIRQLSVIPAS